ncbi:MAG: EamA family transporter, partial [Lachnospiraceae bacterium]|nr:EamA family transporter [Lachnospiraceae bacterium]
IAVKSLIIFIAWIAGFTAVKNMPVGVYGLLDQMRLIFAMLLGVLVLHEHMGPGQIIGLVLVLAGLLLLRLWNSKKDEEKKTSAKYVIFVVISCFFNALSGMLDKILMSGDDLTDGQLQFWYMLFLVIYYLLYIIIKRPGIRWKESVKNGWIWVLAILFVVADRCLFIANGYPESKVTVMTLIKQSSCIVTILGGRLFFKEEGLLHKLACAALVFAGIVAAALL